MTNMMIEDPQDRIGPVSRLDRIYLPCAVRHASQQGAMSAAPAAWQVAHAADTRSTTATAAAAARAPPVVVIATAPALFPCMVPVLVTRLGRNDGLRGKCVSLSCVVNSIRELQLVRQGLPTLRQQDVRT